MPHIVHLPLTIEDFRQHPALETEPRHWLLDSVYGRQLLKTKLQIDKPELKVSLMREQRELEPQLNVLIDTMELRDWPQPKTFKDRLHAFRLQLKMLTDVLEGRKLTDWRTD